MKIGFDFDNTIISYDALFHKVASEQGLVDHTIAVNKLAVRDFLRANNREDVWTEMQGCVYGARMEEAELFPDVIRVIQKLRAAGHTLAIISHRTQYPYRGHQYDLHSAARNWIAANLCNKEGPLFSVEHIFFEKTKEDKLARIRDFKCDVFIDDLPEILLAPHFPVGTRRFLFDPDNHHSMTKLPNIQVFSSWMAVETALL